MLNHRLFLVCLLACTVSTIQAQDIDPKAVKQAIDRGIDFLRKQQNADGSWKIEGMATERCGTTALSILAMRSCGIPPNDPSIQRAMQYMRPRDADLAGGNYSLSLQTMAFCAVDPIADLPHIRRNIALLDKNQSSNREHSGGWHYSPDGSSDLSNAQFSILALYEAERVGVKVNDVTWRKALRYWAEAQNTDGGWGYTPLPGTAPRLSNGSSGATGSMTCAGIASLIVSAGVFERGGAAVQGNQILCLRPVDDESSRQIKHGVDWLERNFSVTTNPRSGSYLLYYLYALERVGRMTNQRFIGRHDWYRAGTEKILALHNPLGNGSWSGGGYTISDTAFALLFLSKGRRPVLMSKVQFGSDDGWNAHPNDINNLTLFVESQPLWPSELTWQIIDIKHATVDHLLQSPVLSFSAKDWGMTPNEMQILAEKLRDYLDQGGFILAEAQPGSRTFDNTFRALMQKVFPEPGYELTLLERSHPIWTAEKTIDPEHIRPLEGIQYGCRTSVIYVPPVAGKPSLSCLWEVYRHFNREGTKYPEVVQRQIDNGLGIGINILAYATSRELKGKDEIPENVVRKDTATGVRGTIFLPFLDLGITNPAPHAAQNLLFAMESLNKIRIESQARSITLADETLADYPLLFTHGRGAFELTDEQRKRLRTHLERGGFLFANAICSAPAFADSFQTEMKKVFPLAEWTKIPAGDPIFSDNFGGYRINSLQVRLPQRLPGQEKTVTQTRDVPPELWGMRLSADDRWLIVFSPFDVSCALEKTNSLECRGYERQAALRLASNVVLYAIEQ